MSGNFDSKSVSDFLNENHQHAQSNHSSSEQGVRKANSTSVGEVQSRSHAEGTSEDQYESSSREFTNPNKCHAVTFLFYQINKTQTIKYTLESIERRVIDPLGDVSKVSKNAFAPSTSVGIISDNVLATAKLRQDTFVSARQSAVVEARSATMVGNLGLAAEFSALAPGLGTGVPGFGQAEPLTPAMRAQALKQVDEELVAEGLLDKVGGSVSPEAQKRFGFERASSLPTPGVLVKGCLDECNVCEPELDREIQLDLEHKQLENELLKRQIDLLDKSQEYRCCPADEEPTS
jgi:hypothetical protein